MSDKSNKSLIERLEAGKSRLVSMKEEGLKDKVGKKFAWEKYKLKNNARVLKNKTIKNASAVGNAIKAHPGKAAAVGAAVVGAGALAKKFADRKAKHESLRESFDEIKKLLLKENEGDEAPKEDASVTGGVADNHDDDPKKDGMAESLLKKFAMFEEKKKSHGALKATAGGAAVGYAGTRLARGQMFANRRDIKAAKFNAKQGIQAANKQMASHAGNFHAAKALGKDTAGVNNAFKAAEQSKALHKGTLKSISKEGTKFAKRGLGKAALAGAGVGAAAYLAKKAFGKKK